MVLESEAVIKVCHHLREANRLKASTVDCRMRRSAVLIIDS
jgi:hypothetical protein